MSASRDRKNSLHPRQIPRCEEWIWIREPDPAGEGGKGYCCQVRATHIVAYHDEPDQVRSTPTCLAHIGAVLDWAQRRRSWHRWWSRIELPAPVVTALTFRIDTKAAAYGRHRILRTEQIVTGTVEQALFVSQTAIPPAPPRRDRSTRHGTSRSRARRGTQEPLF